MNNYEKYCEFDFVRRNFTPLTVYGKICLENVKLISNKKELEKKYDAVDRIKFFAEKKFSSYSKIKNFLKNIPFINLEDNISNSSDVFLYKKFLNYYRLIYFTLDKPTVKFFDFKWELEELYRYLNIDGHSDTFYVSSKYSGLLEKIRNEISKIDREINEEKKIYFDFIKKEFNIDFSGKDFIVVDMDKINSLKSEYLTAEIYDSSKIILKPKFTDNYLALLKRKKNLVIKEKEIETEIVGQIIKKINKNKSVFKNYIEVITDFDIAVSSYELALKFNLKRPELSKSFKKIFIKKAFFIPLKYELDKFNVKYTPLSFTFDKNINLIYGSNMGGKTVALKTFLLLQTMAQYGFFVPAESFKTVLFDEIFVNNTIEDMKGLSSFAYEIYEFLKAYKSVESGRKTLLILDEFAKTTNVTEAAALVNAVFKDLSRYSNIKIFMATHLSGLIKNSEIDFLSMKGFDRNKYVSDKKLHLKDIIEKIKYINKYMRYELVRIKDIKNFRSDALDIARILGLNENIYRKALKFMEVTDEDKEIKSQ